MQAKASINAPPKSPFCVIGNNGFMFGRAYGHSHSALTSWQRLLNPAQNPHSTVIFISVIFLLFPSLMTAPVSSYCSQSDCVPEWTGGVIDYWQLSDRILNYYWRVWWLAGWGSALSVTMLCFEYWNARFFFLSLFAAFLVNSGTDCKWNASTVSLMLHIFYTNAPQATEVGFKHFNISITGCISAATALCVNIFTALWTGYMCFICGSCLRIHNIPGLKYLVSIPYVAIFDFIYFLLPLWGLEHNWSGPGVFVSVLSLLFLIVHSKASEHHFVL